MHRKGEGEGRWNLSLSLSLINHLAVGLVSGYGKGGTMTIKYNKIKNKINK